MSHPHPHAASHGPHDHGQHDHGQHDHGREGHEHASGRAAAVSRAAHALRPHSHEAADKVDPALEASAEGMRALVVLLAVLAATALLEQAAVVAVSGSVALLGETLHNAADALTAVPLGIAFVLGRRPPSRRYTYGYGRAEDLAGVAIVLVCHRRVLGAGRVCGGDPAGASAPGVQPDRGGRCGASATSSATRRWPCTGSGSAAGSARRRWSRTGCTPGPTGSPHWPYCPARVAWRWAGLGRPGCRPAIMAVLLSVLWRAAREIYRRLMDAVHPSWSIRPSARCAAPRACWAWARTGGAGSATGCRPRPRSPQPRGHRDRGASGGRGRGARAAACAAPADRGAGACRPAAAGLRADHHVVLASHRPKSAAFPSVRADTNLSPALPGWDLTVSDRRQ